MTAPATINIELRDVTERDLAEFYEHQRDPVATQMAAFAPRELTEFMAHWVKILRDDSVIKRTILGNGRVVGNLVCFEMGGERLVGYWIDREHWGNGIATRALTRLLEEVTQRPLFARVAKHNVASTRVLTKCGFVVVGEDTCPVKNGEAPIPELIMKLDASSPDASRGPLMTDFLEWVATGERSYADAMASWRSTCPRLTIWEDALLSGLIFVEAQRVALTPRGKAHLADCNGGPA